MSDNQQAMIFMVDDQPFYHTLVEKALGDFCTLVSLKDGESALMAASESKPDLILLDVEMQGMGGYETCQRLTEMDGCADIPIIFLSAHVEIEDRLKGYEVGGQDYIIKPFELKELRAKVQHFLDQKKQKEELKSMANFASETAMTSMTCMSEIGSILETFKKLNNCDDWVHLANLILEDVRFFYLQGTVQIRALQECISVNDQGLADPLDVAVIKHMLGMERIVHFKSRMIINYEHVSLLVNNMPKEDEDRCGRLRDHLAMLLEGANTRVESVLTMQESSLRGSVINKTVSRISKALLAIDKEQRNSKLATRVAVEDANNQIDSALMTVALSDTQEAHLVSVFRKAIDHILNSHSNEVDLQDRLSEIIKDLKACMPKKQLAIAYPWSEKMFVGVELMDEDHRKLFMLINELVLDNNQESDSFLVLKHLTAIAHETKNHFEREEAVMNKLKYPAKEVHAKEHARLLEEINVLCLRFDNSTEALTPEFIETLQKWFMAHFSGMDADFARYYMQDVQA